MPSSGASTQQTRPVALVTGGNRGLGYEVCRQLAHRGMHVWLGSRDRERGEVAARSLAEAGSVAAVTLDVRSGENVKRAAAAVGAVDVLVNNAGVYLAGDAVDPLDVPHEVFEETMDINCHGVARVTTALLPAMNARGRGRVINVSSDCGRLTTMEPRGCKAAYRISKAALNAMTRLFAGVAAPGVTVNAVCPGWIQTDMGYTDGSPTRTIEQGADTIVWLATCWDPPTNGLWRDREELGW